MAIYGDLAKVAKAAGVSESTASSAYKKMTSGGSSSSKGILSNGASASQADVINTLAQKGFIPNSNQAISTANAVATASYNPATGQYNKTIPAGTIGAPAVPLTPKPVSDISPIGLNASIPAYDPNTGRVTYAPVDGGKGETDVMSQTLQSLQDYIGEPERTDRQAIEKQAGIPQLAQRTRDLESQINTINANNQAAIMQIRNQSSTEGGTAGILSAREDALNRSAAAKLLPLTAMYQAEIGNLNAAKEQVNAYIADENAYQDRVYQWKSDIADKVYDQMTTKQKRQWDLQDQQLQINLNSTKDLNNNKSKWAEVAIDNGQSSVLKGIMSATTQEELDNYVAQLRLQPTGTTDVTGLPSAQAETFKLVQDQSNIKNITSLLSSGGMSTAVGTNILARQPGGFWGAIGKIATVIGVPGLFKDAWKSATGQTQDFISGVEQLQSQLSLDSLINAKAKGATFGALSDTEMRILASSASKLGSWVKRDSSGNAVGYNTTESNFKKELDKINNFAKIDYLLKGGNPEDIDVILKPDGTYWTRNSDDSITQLQ
jgi:hypothetical protein